MPPSCTWNTAEAELTASCRVGGPDARPPAATAPDGRYCSRLRTADGRDCTVHLVLVYDSNGVPGRPPRSDLNPHAADFLRSFRVGSLELQGPWTTAAIGRVAARAPFLQVLRAIPHGALSAGLLQYNVNLTTLDFSFGKDLGMLPVGMLSGKPFLHTVIFNSGRRGSALRVTCQDLCFF